MTLQNYRYTRLPHDEITWAGSDGKPHRSRGDTPREDAHLSLASSVSMRFFWTGSLVSDSAFL